MDFNCKFDITDHQEIQFDSFIFDTNLLSNFHAGTKADIDIV